MQRAKPRIAAFFSSFFPPNMLPFDYLSSPRNSKKKQGILEWKNPKVSASFLWIWKLLETGNLPNCYEGKKTNPKNVDKPPHKKIYTNLPFKGSWLYLQSKSLGVKPSTKKTFGQDMEDFQQTIHLRAAKIWRSENKIKDHYRMDAGVGYLIIIILQSYPRSTLIPKFYLVQGWFLKNWG